MRVAKADRMKTANGDQMRTAICLSGQPREIAEIWRTFVDNLWYHMPNPDVFIYTSQEYNTPELFSIVNPKAYVVEPQHGFEDLEAMLSRVGYQPDNHRNSYLQEVYGMAKVGDLKTAYETQNNFQYDLVVRTRPDLIYLRPITLDLVEPDKINNLIVPEYPFFISEFAIGPNDQMNKYFHVFDWLKEHGETCLKRDNPRLKHLGIYTPINILATYLEDYCGFQLGRPTFPAEIAAKHRKFTCYSYYRIMYRHKLGTYEADLKIQEEEDQRMGWRS